MESRSQLQLGSEESFYSKSRLILRKIRETRHSLKNPNRTYQIYYKRPEYGFLNCGSSYCSNLSFSHQQILNNETCANHLFCVRKTLYSNQFNQLYSVTSFHPGQQVLQLLPRSLHFPSICPTCYFCIPMMGEVTLKTQPHLYIKT